MGPLAGLYGAIFVGFFAALLGGTPSQVVHPSAWRLPACISVQGLQHLCTFMSVQPVLTTCNRDQASVRLPLLATLTAGNFRLKFSTPVCRAGNAFHPQRPPSLCMLVAHSNEVLQRCTYCSVPAENVSDLCRDADVVSCSASSMPGHEAQPISHYRTYTYPSI